MEHLTNIQARLLDELRKRVQDGEPPPSYRELCAKFRWRSTGTVRDHLRALATKGYLELPGSRGGRVRLRERVPSTNSIPIVGRVTAGGPVASDENIEGLLNVPAEWTINGEYFALRVRGDSMEEAGIFDGDRVVVRKQPIANSGNIVAATIEGETTLKRLVKRGSRTLLMPANGKYRPIEVKSDSANIHGVVVGLLRDYRNERLAHRFQYHVRQRY